MSGLTRTLWTHLRRKYGNRVLIVRHDDWCRIYWDDADRCHMVLGLILVERVDWIGTRERLTGFHPDDLGKYTRRLTEAGIEYVVVEMEGEGTGDE